MSEDKRNIPKLRFPGFTDAWEQRKLGEIARNVFGGGTPKTNVGEYWDGNIPWIQSSNVQEDEMFDFNIPKRITELGLNKSAAKLVPQNSIAVVTHVGVGKLVFVPFAYTTSQDYTSLADLETDPIFTCYSLYKRLQDDLHIVQGSAIKGITKDDLLNKEIMVPEIDEQCKIGEYFRSLDNLITLQQRKCDEIKNLKKCMLQKMFPKEGEQIPEIRFPGFTDPWEQRKLGDVLDDMYNGQTPSRNKPDYWNGNINWLSSGELNRSKVYSSIETITEEGQRSANLRVVPAGTFIMAITGLEAAGTRGNCAILGFDTTMNQSCMALFPKMDILAPEFIFQWYRLIGEEYGIRYTQGTKQRSYNAEIIADLDITIPRLEEQCKISSFLDKYDNLITLQQRKLDSMKELKKSLLQLMFI